MARTRRIKSEGSACYHIMSRTNDRRFLFGKGAVKTALVEALLRSAAFSGVELKAYAAMDNHFHVVAKVSRPDGPVSPDEILRRVGVLKGEREKRRLAARWKGLSAAGRDAALKDEQDRLRARMHDVSAFVKTFKEEFDRAFKRDRPYCGSIWSGRFASTLVEDGEYLARCKRYVVYNPVRAGVVTQARDYRWSWCEDDATFAGTDPGEWCLSRVVQIGEGKVFGSYAFVVAKAFAFGDGLRTCAAHAVGGIGYSTHGWRLAKKAA